MVTKKSFSFFHNSNLFFFFFLPVLVFLHLKYSLAKTKKKKHFADNHKKVKNLIKDSYLCLGGWLSEMYFHEFRVVMNTYECVVNCLNTTSHPADDFTDRRKVFLTTNTSTWKTRFFVSSVGT